MRDGPSHGTAGVESVIRGIVVYFGIARGKAVLEADDFNGAGDLGEGMIGVRRQRPEDTGGLEHA